MISLKTQYIFLGKIQNVNITVKREISSDLYLTGNKYRKLKHNLIEFYKKKQEEQELTAAPKPAPIVEEKAEEPAPMTTEVPASE